MNLDWLEARVKDVDGCWVWQQSATNRRQDPCGRLDDKTILVRRVVWEQVHERKARSDRIARCSCGTHLCVHPDHIVMASRSTPRKGKPITMVHRARISATKRATSKLSDEQVREIRSAPGMNTEIARVHGVNPSYVGHLKRYEARRDFALSGLWGGL